MRSTSINFQILLNVLLRMTLFFILLHRIDLFYIYKLGRLLFDTFKAV